VVEAAWPAFDEKYLIEDNVKIGVQVNGKVRGEIEFPMDCDEKQILETAKAEPNVAKYLAEGQLVKEIYIKGKLVSFVVKV
jgi:leucyl-tRNA synthetase